MKWKCPKCGREFSRKDQDHYCVKPQTIDEYIVLQDEAVQSRLREVRAIIHAAIPDAKERISWSMPTFWKGTNLLHFAVFKKHIGFFLAEQRIKAVKLENLRKLGIKFLAFLQHINLSPFPSLSGSGFGHNRLFVIETQSGKCL